MKTIRIFLIVGISFALLQTTAQPLNFFKDNLYNLNYNPASEVRVRGHIGIGISNLNLQLSTNIATYNDVIFRHGQGNKTIDLNGFFARIPKSSYGEVVVDLNNELLGFGFKIGEKAYFSFSSRLRLDASVSVPKDLFQMAKDGNIAHIDEELNVLPLASALLYTDHSIGLQYKISDKITVGARGKFLMGMAGANIKESNFRFTTDSEWNLHLKGDAFVNLYCPKDFINPVEGSINMYDLIQNGETNLFNAGNLTAGTVLGSSWGGGFDLGIDIKLPLNFGVKASLIDFGWLKWNRDQRGATTYRISIDTTHPFYQDGELVFSGLPLESFDLNNNMSISQIIDNILKETKIDTAFLLTEETTESFVMRTNSKFFLEGYYQMKRHKFSALLRLDFLRERTMSSFTLGYNLNLKKILDVGVSYTMAKGSYRNLGIGFSFNPGDVFHFYVSAHNLFTVFFPYANNNFNVQTGIFFTIPVKKPKKPVENDTPQEENTKK